MKTLNYQVLKESGYTGYVLEQAPEKVLQFGEGNFLRAFADCWFDLANERVGWNGKCVLVQPIPQGLAKEINAQQGLYTLCLRGRENGQPVDRRRVISAVSRCLNPYEKADHLAYTDSVRYTEEELSRLDSYGLCITRNEIYARHGRMFSDQNIQDYFNEAGIEIMSPHYMAMRDGNETPIPKNDGREKKEDSKG